MKRGVDSENRTFKEALNNDSTSRRKLSWSESWYNTHQMQED